MTIVHRFALALLLLGLSACASHAPPAPPRDITILVSIDGFRADYLDRGVSPTLSALAADGVRGSMRPSFPSKTFPNHYALITGLRPDRNGIVNNGFEDPAWPGVYFSAGDRVLFADPFWWEEATPLWVTAERAGVRTAPLFWPGSESPIHGVRPSQWLAFNQAMPGDARVDQVLAYIDLPQAERPVFYTLYFDTVDTAGHVHGPDADETNAAIASVDASLARLVAGLQARGYGGHANLVIVADHGMTAVSDDRIIPLDIAPETARVVWDGTFAGVTPLPGHEAQTEAALLGRTEHGECWRKGELPERFHYGVNPRIPAIFCLADLGWRYQSPQILRHASSRGEHGYDPEADDMAALFVAHGPAFAHGFVQPRFDNVAVYPLLARLIGVTPEPNDSDFDDSAMFAH